MTIWYTSDTHFKHANIIKFCDRPFKDVEEMDEILIQRWNEVVKPQDHIWHLGDVTMERGSKSGPQARDFIKLIQGLNGHKRLILGNHDHFPMEVYLEAGFEKIKAIHNFEGIWFTHIPLHPLSMGRGMANVHGHTHNHPSYPPVHRVRYEEVWEGKEPVKEGVSPYLNISVERTNYRPVSLEELKEMIRNLVKLEHVTVGAPQGARTGD